MAKLRRFQVSRNHINVNKEAWLHIQETLYGKTSTKVSGIDGVVSKTLSVGLTGLRE